MMLQDLPVEILARCFKHLSELPDSRKDLEACRLTSKYLSEIAVPILIHHVSIRISLGSLARLEEISQHPVIAKSIRTVEINLSFYDAHLSKDFSLFAKWSAKNISRASEIFQIFKLNSYSNEKEKEERKEDYAKARKAKREWRAIGEKNYDKNNLTPCQMILQEAHEEYRDRFDDQELAKRDNAHLARISVALHRFIGLKGIVLSDRLQKPRLGKVEILDRAIQEKSKLDYQPEFSDSEMKLNCLTACRWEEALVIADRGTFRAPPMLVTAPPPVELIPDIFATLEHSAIFPSEFNISLSAPNDLTVFQMLPDQLRCISHVLHKATKLSFSIDSWTSHTGNRRPYGEIQHLAKLTSAFFDIEPLESLKLNFKDYLSYFEKPKISLGQILPLQTRTWPHLQTLVLKFIPFHQHELKALAWQQSKTVRTLKLLNPYLLSGSWLPSVEYLRSMDKLEQVKIQSLNGREFRSDPREPVLYSDGEEVTKNILREREDNPLLEFYADS